MTALRSLTLILALTAVVPPDTALGQAAAPPKETPWGLTYAERKGSKEKEEKITIQTVLRTSLGDRVGLKTGDTLVRMSVTRVEAPADFQEVRCERDLDTLLKKVTDSRETVKLVLVVDRVPTPSASNESMVRPRSFKSKAKGNAPPARTTLTCTVKPLEKPGSFHVSEVEARR